MFDARTSRVARRAPRARAAFIVCSRRVAPAPSRRHRWRTARSCMWKLVDNHPDGIVSDHWRIARPDDEDMGVVPLVHLPPKHLGRLWAGERLPADLTHGIEVDGQIHGLHEPAVSCHSVARPRCGVGRVLARRRDVVRRLAERRVVEPGLPPPSSQLFGQ